MGRYVRALLRSLAICPRVALTLLVRDPRAAAEYRAIAGDRVDIAALAAARSRRFDLVWYPWNGIRFGSRAPALVTINDDFAFRFPARGVVARWREQRPVARAARDAAHIVTISHWSRAVLAEHFGLSPQRISVIPLRPDPYFAPPRSATPAAHTGEPFVLVVGASEARKNVAFLAGIVERAFPERDVRLIVVGTPEPQVAARLNATTVPVTILAEVDDRALRDLYRSATVVAVPSLAEGFGLVVAEAQACGAAVIAANTSALPEALGDAGIAINPDDPVAWCDALRSLVRDAALNAEYRTRARARWNAVSSEATFAAFLAVLERCVDERA